MFFARRTWLRGTKEGSRARHWQSVMCIAAGLCAWLSAVPMTGFTFVLLYAAVVVLLTSAIVARIYLDGERYLARRRDRDDQPERGTGAGARRPV
jgi:hypothetical protein